MAVTKHQPHHPASNNLVGRALEAATGATYAAVGLYIGATAATVRALVHAPFDVVHGVARGVGGVFAAGHAYFAEGERLASARFGGHGRAGTNSRAAGTAPAGGRGGGGGGGGGAEASRAPAHGGGAGKPPGGVGAPAGIPTKKVS